MFHICYVNFPEVDLLRSKIQSINVNVQCDKLYVVSGPDAEDVQKISASMTAEAK